MIPQNSTCPSCGAMMDYQVFKSRAGDAFIVSRKCTVCGEEITEGVYKRMLKDNEQILKELSDKQPEERDLPWPDP